MNNIDENVEDVRPTDNVVAVVDVSGKVAGSTGIMSSVPLFCGECGCVKERRIITVCHNIFRLWAGA